MAYSEDKTIGDLIAITGDDLDLDNDKVVVWDVSAPAGQRTKHTAVGEFLSRVASIIIPYIPSILARSLPFSNPLNVKLDRACTSYVRTQVGESISLSVDPANTFPGATATVELVANGVNVPIISGAKLLAGSSYDNRNGVLNIFQFINIGGTFWVLITQEDGVISIDRSPVTILSATISDATRDTILIVLNKAILSDPPSLSSFTISGATRTITSLTIVGSTLTIKVNTPFTSSHLPQLSYVQPVVNAIQDTSGNFLQGFSSLAITNNILPPDIIPPTLISAAILDEARNTVRLVYSESIQAVNLATSAFTIAGVARTITGVSISGSIVSLTVDSDFAFGQSPTISYAVPGSNPIRDLAGNSAAAFTNQAIANQVLNSVNLTFPTRTANLSVNGTTFTNSGTATWGDFMLSSQSLPANTPGWIAVTQPAPNRAIAFGFKTVNSNGNHTTITYGAFVSSGGAWFTATPATAISGAPTEAGSVRFRVRRDASGVITLEKLVSAPDTWTVLHTYAGTTQAQLFIGCAFAFNGSQAVLPQGFGVV